LPGLGAATSNKQANVAHWPIEKEPFITFWSAMARHRFLS
jgi:hypothetical protein